MFITKPILSSSAFNVLALFNTHGFQSRQIDCNSGTLIDNICMTFPGDCTSGVLSCDLSDHQPVFIGKRNVFMSPDVSSVANLIGQFIRTMWTICIIYCYLKFITSERNERSSYQPSYMNRLVDIQTALNPIKKIGKN